MLPFFIWGETMDYFKGIIPEERYKNDVLNELRAIRELLEKVLASDSKTSQPQERVKRPYNKRGA